MSGAQTGPGGLSLKEFESMAVDAGSWLWGMVQGAWNEKQSLSQIVVDAVIGMIPVVGDVTAARDLIAVGTGLATQPEKREEKMQWVLLVILIFALIPVIGGVIKGVGRLALRVTADVAKDSVAIAKIAQDIIAFLNRIGHKNAELWLKTLNVLEHERALIAHFRSFCDTVILAINRYALRFKAVLPQSLVARMEQLAEGFKQLKALGESKIPDALKDLHQRLQQLQKLIHNGGLPPPDKAKALLAQTGQKTVTYAEEARLVESGVAKKVVQAGKYGQNIASAAKKDAAYIEKIYKHEPGFIDLLARTDPDGIYYPAIAAAAGKIKNEYLAGETVFRAFGEAGSTHGAAVGKSFPTGLFWGRGKVPTTAEEWRQLCAVLDEWNRNGWLCFVHIPKDVKIPASTSTVAEQFSKKIPGQFLTGGAQQAAIAFEKTVADAANTLFAKGGGKLTLSNGMVVEIKQSRWHGINGKIGYGQTVIPGASVVERLGVTELQTKAAQQTTIAAAKNERNQQSQPKR